MQFYVLDHMQPNGEVFVVSYIATLKDAQAAAKAQPRDIWHDLAITAVDIATDKPSVAEALNGRPVVTSRGQVWGLSTRGGLIKE